MWYGVCTRNQQLTRSTLTNLRSIYRQLLQHQHGMVQGLIILVGSGLIDPDQLPDIKTAARDVEAIYQ